MHGHWRVRREKEDRGGKWINDIRPLKGRWLEVHWLKGSDQCYQDGGENSYRVVVGEGGN